MDGHRRRQYRRSKVKELLDELNNSDINGGIKEILLFFGECTARYLLWRERHIRQVKAGAHYIGKELPKDAREFFVKIWGIELSWYLPPNKKII